MVEGFKAKSGPLPAMAPLPEAAAVAPPVATPAAAPAQPAGAGLAQDAVVHARQGQRGSGPLPDFQPVPELEAQIPLPHLPATPHKGPQRTAIIGKIRSRRRLDASLENMDAYDGLFELGVVASLLEVATAYTRTSFDPTEIGASLGRFLENLVDVGEQATLLPGVGELLMGLGGLATIASGVKSFQAGIAMARSAEDAPDKVGASMGAAAGAAKIVGGLATALAALCPPLAAVGAALTAAGVAMDAGRLALENRAPLGEAMAAFKAKLAAMMPDTLRDALAQTVKLVSNNGSAMVEAGGLG